MNTISCFDSTSSAFSKMITIYGKETQQLIKRKFEFKVEVETNFNLSREEVMIRLSDPNDPFFLYMISINEQTFNKIKSSENLLFDFISFPKTLIDLFETCFEEQNKDNPRFMLSLNQMNKDFIVLDIIETNVFKHLVYFSLRIPSANPEFVKSSFTNNYRNLKHEKERLESCLKTLELKLNESNISKRQDLDLIRSEHKNQLKELEIQYRQEIDSQKHLINELNAKDIESKRQIEDLRKELALNVETIRREQRQESERDLHLISELNDKTLYLEQQLTQTKEMYEKERSDAIKYKQLAEERQKLLNEVKADDNSLAHDLSKANEIIRKLQSELQTTHQKLHLLNKVTSKQELTVDQHQSAVQGLESELRQCTQQLKSKDKELQTLRKDFEALKKKCAETESQQIANQNIITYLNKQISDLQAKHGKPVGPKVLVERQTNKTDPKRIAQRNALFGDNPKADNLFKR